MSIFKKSGLARTFAVLALLISSMVSIPRQANAGGILLVASYPAGTVVTAAGAWAMAGAGFALGLTGGLLTGSHSRAVRAAGILLLVLDDKSTATTGSEAAFAERYSFIEDRAVIRSLSETFAAKAEVAPAVEGGKLVQISRAEILDILAPTDVVENHPEQVEAMIAELQ